MIKIKYVCSNGKEYNLIGDRMRATSGYFHSYEWKPNATQMEIGDDVYGFSKEAVTYSITLTLRGKLDGRKAMLDELTNAFEYDVVNLTPGRIYFGNYYIECYVKALNNEVSKTWNNWTDCKVEIYCPYPFWSEEQKKSFFKGEDEKGEEYEFLDYPFDFSYDYSKPVIGTEYWSVEHYRPSNFELIIYGPCANPRITIDKNVYQVFDTLERNEYIIIASKTKTVMKHLANGTVQNIFYKRGTENSVFALIPNGDLIISWSGEFGFDIIVYKERSVPEWISYGQTYTEKN